MRLDTESLRTLKLAVELGSLTAAAGQLSMSLSAVSWKLKRLETKLGRKLIHRNGHKIEATADAQQLLGYADVIVEAHDKAIQLFRLSDVQGRLIIGITDDLAANQLPGFVREFHRGHPGVQLEIKVEQQLTLLEWFEERVVDIVMLPLEETHILATDTVLWEDELVWVKSKEMDYPLSKPVPLVTFSPNCTYRNAALKCLERHGVDYYVSMESPSLAGVQGIVSSGMGVTLINRGLMTEDQCEWKDARAFGVMPGVKFVIRATRLIPERLSGTLVEALQGFLVKR
ncbi:MAG: LysR family transcriptional regulator [Thiolinea sp.]